MLRNWMMGTLAVALLVVACGDDSDETTSTSTSSSAAAGGEDDGRFRPDANGTMISEEIACATLQTAFEARSMQLGCSKTIRTCPQFLRVPYDPDCAMYDEGTVDGCKNYYEAAPSCEELVDGDCVLQLYPGTEPPTCI